MVRNLHAMTNLLRLRVLVAVSTCALAVGCGSSKPAPSAPDTSALVASSSASAASASAASASARAPQELCSATTQFSLALGFDIALHQAGKDGETPASRAKVKTIVANVLQGGADFQLVAPTELADEVITVLEVGNEAARKLLAGAPVAEVTQLFYKPEASKARKAIQDYASQQC